MKEWKRITPATFHVFDPLLIMDSPELRISASTENRTVSEIIEAAEDEYEGWTGNVLRESVWDKELDAFPAEDPIETPAPLLSVEEIVYSDAAGAPQTLDPSYYVVDNGSPKQLGRISIAYGQAWPGTYPQANAVRVRIKAGWESPNDVPAIVKRGIIAFVQAVYDGIDPDERDKTCRSYWRAYRRHIVG